MTLLALEATSKGIDERYRRDADLLAAVLITQRQIASADFDIDAVMGVVLDNVAELTGAERAAVALARDDGELVIAAARGMADASVGHVLVPGASPLRRVFDTGLSMISDDLAKVRPEAASLNRSRSGVAVPLEHHRRRLGVLVCSSPRAAAFTAADVQALELLAGFVGPALAQAREVQRRWQVEAELRASQARLTAIVETMAEGVLIMDAEGVITFANPAAERMLKRPRGSLAGRDWRGARIRPHHLDGRPMRDEEGVLARLRRSPEPVVGEELRFLRPDRSFLDTTVNAAALRDEHGAVSGFVVSINDSTERRRAETVRRESEERLEAIVASTLDAIVAYDVEGRIVEFNRAAEALFGRSRAEVIGQPVRILIAGRLRARADSALAQVRARPQSSVAQRFETTGVRGDGSDVRVEVSLTSVNRSGRALFVASARDLSERERAESARRESEAKSRFLAAMSHELRTPLNSILGFSQLLERSESGALDERQRRYVENIRESGQHLLELVDEVLDLSRVAAGAMHVEVRPVELASVVDEAVRRLAPLAGAKRLHVETRVERATSVLADRRRLSQVLANLLSNAVKFTPEGGSIRVTGEVVGEVVELAVEDDGIGIPAERLEDVFGEFTQVESSLSRTHDGAGLGLALTHRLVSLMGGRISVESELGRGSRFLVTLPAASPKPPQKLH